MTNKNASKEAKDDGNGASADAANTAPVDQEAEERRNMLRELRANQKAGGTGLAARKVSGGGGERPALRNLLAKRRAASEDGAEGGGGQGRGQLLQMLMKRRRGQAGEGPGVTEDSSLEEIAAHRERLESRAERLERVLKGVLAEIDETRDLERRVSASAADDSDSQ